MKHDRLQQMRALRHRAQLLHQDMVSDYSGFYDGARESFFNFPSKPLKKSDPFGVTTTCTALMALSLSGKLVDFAGSTILSEKADKQDAIEFADRLLGRAMAYRWTTAGLSQNNAFTTALVVRTCGVLSAAGLYPLDTKRRRRPHADEEMDEDGTRRGPIRAREPWRRFRGKAVTQIAKRMIDYAPKSLSVQRYPATPAIAYWLMDGIRSLGVAIGSESLNEFGKWATDIFRKQMSLVVAKHASLRDPVALAMAACLCRCLSDYAQRSEFELQSLPTRVELEKGVEVFFRYQNRIGTWEKYFPLFHYPEAGADYCWHFEVLEAILQEFPNLSRTEESLERLQRSVGWLDANRLTWTGSTSATVPGRGWNSGGNILSLERGEPESWATGAVHMCLQRLETCMSEGMNREVLHRYGVLREARQNADRWDRKTLDGKLELQGEDRPRDLKAVIEQFIIKPIERHGYDRRLPDGVRRSTLLFGPPGTGKTSLVGAVASKLGWEFVEINPSRFLKNGLDGIYNQADEIFSDMKDLQKAVVFFDELDAMLQRRVGRAGRPALEVAQQFLTTSMLPHLAELYDINRILFFVATNYRQTFDEAIVRPGRFDMLLCIGPPHWEEKVKNLQLIVSDELCPDERSTERARERLTTLVSAHDSYYDGLNAATVKEIRAFFEAVAKKKRLDEALKDEGRFRREAQKWAAHRFSLRAGTGLRTQWDAERGLSEVR